MKFCTAGVLESHTESREAEGVTHTHPEAVTQPQAHYHSYTVDSISLLTSSAAHVTDDSDMAAHAHRYTWVLQMPKYFSRK